MRRSPEFPIDTGEEVGPQPATGYQLDAYLVGLKNAFEEAGVTVPEETATVLDGMEDKDPAAIERTVDALTDVSASSPLLEKIRSLPAWVKRTILALTVCAEIAASAAVYAKTGKGETKQPEGDSISAQVDEPKPTTLKFEGNRIALIDNDRFGIFLEHHIHRPESLIDLGKMFLEPVSLEVKFPVARGSWPAKVITGGGDEPFLFSADVPYEYAQNFDKATPVDKGKMEAEMQQNAREFLGKALPFVFGPSFFKKDIQSTIGQTTTTAVDAVTVKGFASGESDRGIDLDDPRNKQLSELRAENATEVITKLLKDQGIEAKVIQHEGKGEEHLTPEERAALLQDAYRVAIAPDGQPEEERLLALIRQYNDHQITEAEALTHLEQMVGGKRKVAITLETSERTAILVLPLPFLLAALLLWPHRQPRSVYAHFVGRSATGPVTPVELTGARGRGATLRFSPPVASANDAVKGYSPKTGPEQTIRDEIVGHTPHLQKGTGRTRVELEFDSSRPLNERAAALAFVLDRYARLAGRLGPAASGEGDVDLVNIFKDYDALQSFLDQIATPGLHGRPVITPGKEITFEFQGSSTPASGIHGERADVVRERVQIDYLSYDLDLSRLSTLADLYRTTYRHP